MRVKTSEIIGFADYPTKARWKIAIATIAALALVAWLIHAKISPGDQLLIWPAYVIVCFAAWWRIRHRKRSKTPRR